MQREAARPDWVVKAQALASQYSSLADDDTLEAEMQRVERHVGLPASIRPELRWLFNDGTTHARRLTIVGAAYKMVLRHLDCLERVDFELSE